MLSEHINMGAAIKIYQVGQIVDDFVEKNSFGICTGKIVRIVSESEIEVEVAEKDFPDFQKNVCYMMHIHMPESVYRCSIYYHSMYSEENQNYICLEIVSSLEKMQRRRYQRVSCHSKIEVTVIEEQQIDELLQSENRELFSEYESSEDMLEESMVDIGGGGIRFTTKRSISFCDYLLVRFEIFSGDRTIQLHVLGQVVYAAPLPNDTDCCDVRMKYVGLSQKEREEIIQFAFQLERENKKKNWS